MELTDRAVELAMTVGQIPEEMEEQLTVLCAGAVEMLRGRLKAGVGAEDCAPALVLAAAWTALADLCMGECADRVESFTAGAVTVRQSGGDGALARSRGLREQAERVMAPYVNEQGFAFRGVRG